MRYKEDELKRDLDLSRYTDDSIYINLKKYTKKITDGDSISWDVGLKENIFCQGDVLNGLVFINAKGELEKSNGMLFSHTCDMHLENKLRFPVNIVYGRVVSLDKFIKFLKDSGKFNADAINAIKRQENKFIFYLPKSLKIKEDALVLMERVGSYDNTSVSRDELPGRRIYSLNQFGRWILLIKMRFLYTRLYEEGLNRA